MKIHFYLSRTIVSAILLVLVIFVGLVLFVALLSEIGSTGRGGYGFFQAVVYVLYTLPLLLYQVFPTVVLIGVLIGLGTLASSNELTVMRTAGMALTKITLIILFAVMLIVGIATLLGETVVPQLAKYAENQKTIQQNNGQVITTLNGVWLHNGNDFFHIMKVDAANKIEGVTYFQFNDDYQLLQASQADVGEYINGVWQFSNARIANVFFDHVQQTNLPTVIWPLKFNFHQLVESNPSLLTLKSLYQQIKFGADGGVNIANYQVNFWSRIFQPLTTLIMVLIAVPFIFGPLRSVSIGLRLLSGIFVGLIFFIMEQFLASLSQAYQIPPALAASILPLIFFLFAIYLFWWKG